MPLPVERSQGSVSALVARFQTAADRDKEAQAREAGRGPRLSGTASRRTSSFGVASVGDVQSTLVTPVVKSDSESKQNGLSKVPAETEVGQAREVQEVLQDLKLKEEAAKEPSASNGHEEPLVRRPSGDLEASSTSVVPQEKEKSDEAATPPKPIFAPASKEKTPLSPVSAKASNGTATLPKSPGAKTSLSSISPTNPRTPVKRPQPTPVRAGKAGPSQTSPTTKRTPAPSQPKSTTTRTIMPKATTTTVTTTKLTPSSARPSAASTTSSRRLPTSGSSASSRSPAKPLVPAMTGPASSRPTPPESSHITHPAPLKPHLTGTPSKPTASFLAKQRTPSISQSPESPEKKRQSLSLGRASGSRLSGLVGRAGSASPSASVSAPKRDVSTPSKAPTTTSGTSSRLLQGTAASRARAAAASPKGEVNDRGARGASTSPTTAKTPGSTPSRMPPVGKSPIGRIGLAGAREKQKAKPAQTPAVGLSPIGRQGLAEAREKATANGTDANGVDHPAENGKTTSPSSAPVVEPKVVATPDGPVDGSEPKANGLEQQSHREDDVNDTTQVEAAVHKTSTRGDEKKDIPEIPTSA